MRIPPPGYDDPTIVAYDSALAYLSSFELKLKGMKRVFQREHVDKLERSEELDKEEKALRRALEEFGGDHIDFALQLFKAYDSFKNDPSESSLDEVLARVKRLMIFLQE